VRVEGAADAPFNARYVVRHVVYEYRRATPHEPGLTYSNRVAMVPADRPARPPLPARPARAEGIELADTTGPRGEEIHVDDLGRVKLRFFWDRSGITDDRSSAWTRSLQMPLGAAMLLPRVGWEVPVVFLDGDPDRPIVLGRLHNATAVVPYALPAASATTAFQSATSPGAAGTNEIRMGDTAGSQEFFVHASRDQSVSVGGKANTTVGASETHDIGLSYAVTVDASQKHSVGASQSVNVATDFVTGVKGARDESIGAAEIVGVGGNRFVAVKGSYAEIVGAAYALQCNQSNTAVKGGPLQAIGGPLALASGMGTSESIAAARFEVDVEAARPDPDHWPPAARAQYALVTCEVRLELDALNAKRIPLTGGPTRYEVYQLGQGLNSFRKRSY
jgi:type VI secretion system secreted protein VgrG